MSYDFFAEPNEDKLSNLNREIDELYEEVEALHRETDLLLGLMSGSFAFFIKHLISAHRAGAALSPEQCEQMVVDALRRVISSQQRFEYDLISELRTTYGKMDSSSHLSTYLAKAQRPHGNPSGTR